jgi:hypothetical protein
VPRLTLACRAVGRCDARAWRGGTTYRRSPSARSCSYPTGSRGMVPARVRRSVWEDSPGSRCRRRRRTGRSNAGNATGIFFFDRENVYRSNSPIWWAARGHTLSFLASTLAVAGGASSAAAVGPAGWPSLLRSLTSSHRTQPVGAPPLIAGRLRPF